jgi:hypothetical protein
MRKSATKLPASQIWWASVLRELESATDGTCSELRGQVSYFLDRDESGLEELDSDQSRWNTHLYARN